MNRSEEPEGENINDPYHVYSDAEEMQQPREHHTTAQGGGGLQLLVPQQVHADEVGDHQERIMVEGAYRGQEGHGGDFEMKPQPQDAERWARVFRQGGSEIDPQHVHLMNVENITWKEKLRHHHVQDHHLGVVELAPDVRGFSNILSHLSISEEAIDHVLQSTGDSQLLLL